MILSRTQETHSRRPHLPYLNTLEEEGALERVFQERGIVFHHGAPPKDGGSTSVMAGFGEYVSRQRVLVPAQMAGFPTCSGDQVIRALERAGFTETDTSRRTRGSYHTYARPNLDGRTCVYTVVVGKREVPRSTLRSILRQAELTIEEFCSYT